MALVSGRDAPGSSDTGFLPAAIIDHNADRDLERQFAEGAARESRLVARAREARRAADAGGQALRPRTARGGPSSRPATSSPTTVKAAGMAWRSRAGSASPT